MSRRGDRTTLVAALAALLLAAPAPSAADGPLRPGQGVTVRPAATEVREERFQTLIVERALQALGYRIAPPTLYDYQTMHLALGSGQADFAAVHWEPLHDGFFAQAGGASTLRRLGVLIDGAVQGYVVDKASFDAGVTNLADLRDPAIARRFDRDGDGKADLVGCPRGWGCNLVIEHHLDAYGLRATVAHDDRPHAQAIASVLEAEDAGRPLLFYTWTPYWVSGALPQGEATEWLETPFPTTPDGGSFRARHDGRMLGWPVSRLRIVANRAFLEANPAAAALFEVASIPIEDISAQNILMFEGARADSDIEAHAEAWIAANEPAFNAWLAAARTAAENASR
ncbi:MAG: glycine betaine/L-proline ABC transporter substrate-binding protein ProX [Pseudomonadota bacterium]